MTRILMKSNGICQKNGEIGGLFDLYEIGDTIYGVVRVPTRHIAEFEYEWMYIVDVIDDESNEYGLEKLAKLANRIRDKVKEGLLNQ